MYIIHMFFIVMLGLYVVAALTALILAKKPPLCNIISNVLSALGALAGIYTSLSYMFSRIGKIDIFNINLGIPYISIHMSLDRLSAFFILVLSLLVLCVSVYSIGYISHYYDKRNIGVFHLLYNLFICSMVLVLTSGNIIFFLITWELMALTSYFLVIYEADQGENQKAGTLYLIMTHIGTAFLTIAFMLIYKYTHRLDIEWATIAIPPMTKNIILIFFLIGFGTKAGIIPFHVWLPYAHPAAPSNVSALMSGIMLKTAVYGLCRFIFALHGTLPLWWGMLVLCMGIISAVLGVAYAFMENNIKRLLAYSSIENIGIIFIGLGISFSGYAAGNRMLCGLALTAALLHLFNHCIFKSTLFMGAGAVHFSTHTKEMEKLGGLMKKMPYTGLFFLMAALAASAIPPFNGFVGEWLTYQALFVNMGNGTAGIKLLSILAVAGLAIAGALAAACFVKVIGISFLGLPRNDCAANAREVPLTMKIGMAVSAALCLLTGVMPLPVLRIINDVGTEMIGYTPMTQMQGAGSFIYAPVIVQNNGISPLIVLVAGVLVFIGVILLVSVLGRETSERKYGTWDCGFESLNARMQYSATGFSKPLRIVFRTLFRPTRELQIEEGPSPYYHKSMKYVVSTESVFEKYLYQPVIGRFVHFSRKTRLIVQTGSIHAYLIYIFAAVIAALIYYSMN